MKTIGFIDYYLSEWHANNYPEWIKKASADIGCDFEVKYAWAELEVSPLDGVSTDEWCKKYGATRCDSIDEPAGLFGELLGEIFSYGYSGEARLVTYECGLHLGRFIYAADAAEDYEKDRRSGSYNPYLLAYGGADLTAENRSSIKRGLLLECSRIEAAINLMPFDGKATIENIIKNIICLGLVKRIDFLDERKEQ